MRARAFPVIYIQRRRSGMALVYLTEPSLARELKRGDPEKTGDLGGPRSYGRRLREDDLDPAILRLANAWRRGNARIVHAATGDGHVAAWHTKPFERGGDGIGTPFGEPLVVAR